MYFLLKLICFYFLFIVYFIFKFMFLVEISIFI